MMDLWKCSKIGMLVGAVSLLASCAQKEKQWEHNTSAGEALGTTYHIIYLTKGEANFQQSIDSVFTAVNHSLSTYIPESDISKVNRGDSTLVVDKMFRDVFELSNKVYKRTHGYFDPTVGILVNAWGFGPGNSIKMDSTRVDSLLEYVGFDKVELTPENTIHKKFANMYFDFNAIAKGYTIDRLAKMLDGKHVANYLIEVGGEVVAKGQNIITQKQWTVGVENPQTLDRSHPKRILNLKDMALASSGNYRKFRIDSITGRKYVHTIDPISGFTKSSNVLGASVIAPTCAEADAFATAFMAMDLDDSIKLLTNQEGLDAYIIYLNRDGKTEEFMTKGFKARLID